MLHSNRVFRSTSLATGACLVSEIETQVRMQNQPSNEISLAGDAAAITVVEAEISRIQTLKSDEVRALWCDAFKRKVPAALTRDLLVRILCWNIQEKAFGGHSLATLKLLASYAKGRAGEARRLRRLKPGTELLREYQGQRHTVVITGQGFRWRDGDYPSLTAIGRAITGTNWNGPRFFGLRGRREGPGTSLARTGAPAEGGEGLKGTVGGAHV